MEISMSGSVPKGSPAKPWYLSLFKEAEEARQAKDFEKADRILAGIMEQVGSPADGTR